MSKFAEKIRRATHLQPQPLGFGSARNAASPTMVLVGRAKDGREAADLARAGADAVIVGSPQQPAVASDAGTLDGAIAGACIGGNDAKAYREGGFDFVVFDPDRTPATSVLDEQAGYVLILPGDLTDVQVRALETFSLDAIDVGAIDGGLTVRRQIDLQRIFALTRKPLLAAVVPSISVPELQALRDTNVVAIAAEGASAIEQLRKTVDALPPRTRRRDDERPTPLVPRASGGDDDDDDDDDHDH